MSSDFPPAHIQEGKVKDSTYILLSIQIYSRFAAAQWSFSHESSSGSMKPVKLTAANVTHDPVTIFMHRQALSSCLKANTHLMRNAMTSIVHALLF